MNGSRKVIAPEGSCWKCQQRGPFIYRNDTQAICGCPWSGRTWVAPEDPPCPEYRERDLKTLDRDIWKSG